jgi:hypothetical protein
MIEAVRCILQFLRVGVSSFGFSNRDGHGAVTVCVPIEETSMRRAKVIAKDSAHSNYWRERNLRAGNGERVAGIDDQFDTVFRQVSRVATFFGTLLVLHYITSGVSGRFSIFSV